MGRLLRPSLPGVPFHVTTRTQWGEPLFRGAEAEIVALIRESIDRSDAQLLAYAVMSNHVHLVLMQGRRPLASYMQPLLRRVALLAVRRRGQPGHVFAGRFRHNACHDADYFRSIVTYVHLNPVRAGLCRAPGEYAWTSHGDYARGCSADAPTRYVLAIERALRTFARASEQALAGCRRDYRAYARWRLAMDDYLRDESGSWRPVPRAPLSVGGDRHWQLEYGSANAGRVTGTALPRTAALDLRDHVRILLDDLAPDLPFDLLRSGGRSRPLVRVRNQIIARALAAGYTTAKLAAFLNVSTSAVSGVRASLRGGSA